MEKKLLTFYAVSPIHAGSGTSLGAVDLPIQRERHTNWPHIQASAVKGALRSHFRTFFENRNLINYIFGSDKDNDEDYDAFDKKRPGIVAFSDAKLFAFPVRSNKAPFVWITCPLAIERFNRDLEFLEYDSDNKLEEATVEGDNAFYLTDDFEGEERIILEDAVVTVGNSKKEEKLNEFFPEIKNLLLVSDEMFNYLVSTATEIQTQIKINEEKGTAEEGALRYEELLPADSVLYSVVYVKKEKITNGQEYVVSEVLQKAIKGFVQLGGDETLGRGICKVRWIKNNEED